MKNAILLCILTSFFIPGTFAQYNTPRNKVWAFGDSVGLDFSSGVPVPFSTSINTIEGSASVCNPAGALLFYTDGANVYNRLGAAMPHGTSIVSFGTISTTQAALVVPVYSNNNQYYLFSLEQQNGSINFSHLAYCIVDMTLDGGNGDIVPGTTNTLLDSNLSEKLTTVAGDSCNVWLIAHKKDSAVFVIHNITPTGISARISTSIGSFNAPGAYERGVLKISPDRSRIVSQSAGTGGTELFDFNPSTGVVSNCRLLSSGDQYGAEFSPDGTKLYVCGLGSGQIQQYDISLSTTAAIISSLTNLASVYPGTVDIKLAPDNKIYYGVPFSTYLNCISNPNLGGTACGLVTHAVTLSSHSITQLGLPNVVVAPNCITTYALIPPSFDAGMAVFPNPVNGNVYVKLSSKEDEDLQMLITNTLGVAVANIIVRSNVVNALRIDMPPGTYTFSSYVDNHFFATTVVIK